MHRAPPSLSLGLNADLLKRIVHRLANLPAASAAENSSANVMRVVALPAYLPAARSTIKLHRSYTKDALIYSSPPSLATEWSTNSGQPEVYPSEERTPQTPISK